MGLSLTAEEDNRDLEGLIRRYNAADVEHRHVKAVGFVCAVAKKHIRMLTKKLNAGLWCNKEAATMTLPITIISEEEGRVLSLSL